MAGAYKTRLVNTVNNYLQQSRFLNGTINGKIETLPNPKWDDFEGAGIRRQQALVNNSVTHSLIRQTPGREFNPAMGAYGQLDVNYYNRVYSPLDGSKANRIYEYRTMASYPTVQDGIMKYANSFINQDERGECIHFKYADSGMNIEHVKDLTDTFNSWVRIFDFINNGKKYCSDFLIEGECFFELIINDERPENKAKGILGVLKLPTELMDVVYEDKYNGVIKSFIGQEITSDDVNHPAQVVRTKPVFLHPNQVFYVNSGERDPLNEYIVPFINRARKRYIQLSFLEDAIVIYRLARAPEKLVFTADCGNMASDEAEAYLRRLQQQMYKQLNFDPNNGDIMQRYSPASMLDAFWFAKTAGNEGINVTTLSGGQNLGELADLDYFKRALYESLCLPTSHLPGKDNNAQAATDNSTILQEELTFAESVIDIQRKWAAAVKQAFITHLKYTKMYQEYGVQERFIDIEFEPPSNYYKHRKLQSIQIAGSAFGALASNEVLSKSYLMKHVMGMSESDIVAQYELRKKEAMHEYEIAQIQAAGPNWKMALLTGGEGAEGGGGDMGGGGMGGGFDMGGGMSSEMEAELGGAEGGGDLGDLAAEGAEAAEVTETNPGGDQPM